MSNRDWSKEFAKIDRQLERASDEALLPTPREATPAAQAQTEATRRRTSTLGVAARLVLAWTLGVAMLFWPNDARCGAALAGYLLAVGVLFVAGVWTSIWSWHHRSARAHLLALALVAWGTVLGARQILPRVGYAIPDAGHPATWACP